MPILAGFMVPHPPLIIPAVGKGGEQEIEKTAEAYRQVAREIAALKPETIIVTSPHALMYADYFHISPGTRAQGSFADFRAGYVRLEETYDAELADLVSELAAAADFPAGTLGERESRLDHGTMVPLWFIEQEYTDFKLVRIGLSGLPLSDHYRFGQIIQEAVRESGRRVVFVASGDLSHKLKDSGPYGFAPEGPLYDARIMDAAGRAAFGEMLAFEETFCEKAAECGHRSFVIMAGAFDGEAIEAKVLSHEDVTGVGYGIATFYPKGPDESRHFLGTYLEDQKKALEEKRERADAYVKLARASLESWIKKRRKIGIPDGLPEEMLSTRAGAFVSIHKHGKLRGCIGTIVPTTPSVAQEIINNAISASTRDPRFSPITEDELPWLDISVDVLGEAEDIDSPDELDVKRYGVIVSCGKRSGLLLPDLDGVDSVEEQIQIALQKGGISTREPYRLQRFEVVRHV